MKTARISVDAFLQLSITGLVATAFCALAASGLPGRATIVLTLAGLLIPVLSGLGIRMPEFTASHANIAALAYLAFLPVDYYFLSHDGLAAAIHGISFLSVLRVLTAHTAREYFFAGAISFVQILAACFLSPAGAFSGWLLLYIAFAVAALTSAQLARGVRLAAAGRYRVQAPEGMSLPARLVALASIATAGVLVLTTALFFAVPRTGRASSRFLRGDRRSTGFTTVVDLGGFGGIAKDDSPVMHVRGYGNAARLDWSNVKWRGAALSRFDGRRWSEPVALPAEIPATPGPAAVAGQRQLSRRDGARFLYGVELPEAGSGTLFLAGIPEFVNIDARYILMNRAGMLRVAAAPRDALRYQVSAFSGPRVDDPLAPIERARNLRFPAIDARIPALAREWAGEGNDAERAARIQNRLQRDFRYVLDGPSAPVGDPLADFLFVRREGYCEYFASAMAVMLRSLGIPARVVTGFQGGFFNEITGVQVVRASDAHAWVEAFLAPGPDGQPAWTTYDPTPIAAQAGGAGFSRLSMYAEALSSLWHEWVVAYDLPHQALAATQFRNALRDAFALRSFQSLLRLLLLILAAAAIGGFCFKFAPRLLRAVSIRSRIKRIARQGAKPADAAALYSGLVDRLVRRGFVKKESETPLEFALRLPPAEAGFVLRFTELYNRLRYGGDASAAHLLGALLAEFEPGRPMYN